jgi:hypothetical protein
VSALKSRKTGIAALILSVLIFTPVGVRSSFAREGGKIEDMFYNGIHVKDSGYTAPALYSQIEECQSSALGLLTVAANYTGGDIGELSSRLREARNRSLESNYNPALKKPVADRYMEYIVMYGFTVELYNALSASGMTQRDLAVAADYMSAADSSFTLAMTQAAELSKQTERMEALCVAFPMRFIGGRGARFNTFVRLETPIDGYGVGENEHWNFVLKSGKLVTDYRARS